MKRTSLTIVVLACLVVVLVTIATLTTVSSANAFGTTGVPVRCRFWNSTPGVPQDLQCTAADGTAFGSGGVTVPTGYYLLVTDFVIVPLGPATGYWETAIWEVDGSTYISPPIDLATSTKTNVSEHFTTPYLVIPQGHNLRVLTSTNSSVGTGVHVYVSGLLTTSYNYLPLIAR